MPDSPPPFDVAILGSGFAGTILARVLRSRGQRVLLLEKGSHPRFALGESTTPLANLSLERLARRYGLSDLHSLAAHGRWSRDLPHLRRGLKRGFTFFHHRRGQPYSCTSANETRMLVAASPDDDIADSHWLRHDVDLHLVERARAEGVDYVDRTRVVAVEMPPTKMPPTRMPSTDRAPSGEPPIDAPQGDDHVTIHTEGPSGATAYRARWVVDGTGGSGVLAQTLGFGSRGERIPFSSGLLYGHFAGLEELASITPQAHHGDAPYPPEAAAVHHLLEIGWLYGLRFDHGITSSGLVLRNDRLGLHPEQLSLHPGRALQRLLEPYPSLAQLFRQARPVAPVRYVQRLQYRLDRAAGQRFFLLPHTFAFFDPLFSTGMAWSLLAVERLGLLLTDPSLSSGGEGNPAAKTPEWRDYARLLHQEADQIQLLIEAAYLAMDDFDLFTSLALLYFAAVSFEEVRQRVLDPGEVPHCWRGFLGAGDPVLETLFVGARDRLAKSPRAPGRAPGSSTANFGTWIRRHLGPRDVVGLDRPPKPNLFPVDLDILMERADRLGLDRQDLLDALPRLRGKVEG